MVYFIYLYLIFKLFLLKVWDDKPESNPQVQQNISDNAFNTVYSTASSVQHDKSEMSVIDEQRVHNQQVYRYVLWYVTLLVVINT